MLKKDAVKMFGSQKKLAVALGVNTSAVSHFPLILPQKKIDQIIGAAVRLKIDIPAEISDQL